MDIERQNEEGRNVREKEVMVANKKTVRGTDVVLRFMAFGLTIVSAIVLGLDKQTKVVSMSILPPLPPFNVPLTAKWHYLSAFVYLVVVNAIACAYAAASLLLTLANRGGKKNLISLTIMILDLIMISLLFSGCGAALAVGIIGYKGNSHVRWNKVCNVFDKFCHQVAGAVAGAILGAVAYLLLVLLAMLNLHDKH